MDEFPYRVVYPEMVRMAVRKLGKEAAGQGLAKSTAKSLQLIHQRLCTDPRSFGEPTHRYRALKLEQRVAIVRPLVVRYTVHDELPLVFVKAVNLLTRDNG